MKENKQIDGQTSEASRENFSAPTARPIRLTHSIVLPRRSLNSSAIACSTIYFSDGMNLEKLVFGC